MNQILAFEFQLIRDDGTWSDKKGQLGFIKMNKPAHDSFINSIKLPDIFENGTAIVSGECHVKGRNDKGGYECTYQSGNVSIKRNGIWKAVSSHVSGVKRTEQKRDN